MNTEINLYKGNSSSDNLDLAIYASINDSIHRTMHHNNKYVSVDEIIEECEGFGICMIKEKNTYSIRVGFQAESINVEDEDNTNDDVGWHLIISDLEVIKLLASCHLYAIRQVANLLLLSDPYHTQRLFRECSYE